MEKILVKIVGHWRKSGFIDKSDTDVYIYGLDLLIFTMLNILAIIITSVVINKFVESVILLVAIIPLQSYGGGYHAKTHLRCFLIMYIGWWAVILIMPLITPFIALIMNIGSIIIIFCLAPVPHVNVTMSAEHRLKLRRLVRLSALVIGLLSIILMLLFSSHQINYGIILSTGLGVVALSMIIAQFINNSQNI